MNILPTVTTVAEDVTALLNIIEKQKAESKLFQFLNGLDDCYAAIRSQLLMLTPLPSVDIAYASIQQEESQSDMLINNEVELSAMNIRAYQDNKQHVLCNACGGRGHNGERCWSVVGYPRWHHKYKKPPQKGSSNAGRWNNSKSNSPRLVNVVQSNAEAGQSDVTLTPQQLQQLLKLLPNASTPEDELDNCFLGMATLIKCLI